MIIEILESGSFTYSWQHLISREVSLQLICMDLLKDIVSRFGKDVGAHHKVLLSRLQDKLANNAVEDVPIRAANTLGNVGFLQESNSITATWTCLGALARFLNDELFKSLMDFLMNKIEQKTGDNVTYISAVGTSTCSSEVKCTNHHYYYF